MLEKNPDDRMTIDDVLGLPIITKHAAKYLPKEVFAAEFTNYNQDTRIIDKPVVVKPIVVPSKKMMIKPIVVEPKKTMIKPDTMLPFKALKGVYDTRRV